LTFDGLSYFLPFLVLQGFNDNAFTVEVLVSAVNFSLIETSTAKITFCDLFSLQPCLAQRVLLSGFVGWELLLPPLPLPFPDVSMRLHSPDCLLFAVHSELANLAFVTSLC